MNKSSVKRTQPARLAKLNLNSLAAPQHGAVTSGHISQSKRKAVKRKNQKSNDLSVDAI